MLVRGGLSGRFVELVLEGLLICLGLLRGSLEIGLGFGSAGEGGLESGLEVVVRAVGVDNGSLLAFDGTLEVTNLIFERGTRLVEVFEFGSKAGLPFRGRLEYFFGRVELGEKVLVVSVKGLDLRVKVLRRTVQVGDVSLEGGIFEFVLLDLLVKEPEGLGVGGGLIFVIYKTWCQRIIWVS